MGFDQRYWNENYSDPGSMDGIGNSTFHVQYVKYLLLLDGVQISSLVDLGFGLGHLFEAFKEEFDLKHSLGIEPSEFAYNKYKDWTKFHNKNHQLKNIEIKEWLRIKANSYDLGICTSVFQYLSDDELKKNLPKIAKKVRYLYLTIPTDKELKIQRNAHCFEDRYALSRSRTKYLSFLRPYFTFISSRFLESKYFFDTENTPFNEFLFRF